MKLLESSLARLMLMVLTVGIGLAAMRSQSEVYLGILIAITAMWLLLAIGSSVVVRDGRRAFSAGFLVATTAGLVTGFGPWSDASFRGRVPTIAKDFVSYLGQIRPPTRGFLRLFPEIKPDGGAEVILYNRELHQVGRVTLELARDQAMAEEQMAGDLGNAISQNIAFFSGQFSKYPRTYQVVRNSLSVYFDACYLLASLLIGECAGWTVLLFTRAKERPAGRGDADDPGVAAM